MIFVVLRICQFQNQHIEDVMRDVFVAIGWDLIIGLGNYGDSY